MGQRSPEDQGNGEGLRSSCRQKRFEALWVGSTYLVATNKSGNQKGNLSYLASTKKRSDSSVQLIFHKRRGAGEIRRMTLALFF